MLSRADYRRRTLGLGILFAVAACIAILCPRVAQDPAYHHFADHRPLLGIPNFGDVATNLPFALAGLLGLIALRRLRMTDASAVRLATPDAWCLGTMFVGLIVTAFASAYYHWNPNNATLVSDRMGLTVAFTGFMATLLGERLGARVGAVVLGPLVAAGVASVLYWSWTESNGSGDLRPYAFVQFFPLLALPYLALAFPARFLPTRDLFISMGWYALAKLLELLDRPVFTFDGGAISGHTLKHLAAAMGAYWIVHVLRRAAMMPSARLNSAARPRSSSTIPANGRKV